MVIFIICLSIYLLIGIILTAWVIFTDPWGGLIIPFAPLIIIAYPYFIIRNYVPPSKRRN